MWCGWSIEKCFHRLNTHKPPPFSVTISILKIVESKWIFWCKVSCDPDITNYEKNYNTIMNWQINCEYVEAVLYTRGKAVSVTRSIIHVIWLILDNPIWIFIWWTSDFMRCRIYDTCRTTWWKYLTEHFYKGLQSQDIFTFYMIRFYTHSC